MTKKRVLHIYKDYYPPIVGGIEMHLNTLCHGLADEYEIRVLVANRDSTQVIEKDGPIEIVKAACKKRFDSAPFCPSFPRLINEWKADILHFHVPNPTGELAYLWKKPAAKTIATYHSDIIRQKLKLKLYGPFLKRFLNRMDIILPTSPNYIESSPWLQRVRGKCQPVPLGIKLEEFASNPEREKRITEIKNKFLEPIIFSIGELRYYKGYKFLIEAMQGIDAQCLIGGSGPEQQNLEQQIKELKLQDKVKLLGRISDQEKIDYLFAADIFCFPSHLRSEAFGLSQIEAMACGLPVVGCNIPSGTVYVNQDNQTGLLAEPANPESLKQKLNQILNDQTLRQQLSQNAKTRAHQEFSANKMIQTVKKIYNELLEK